jgi:hypothetical protein
MDALRRRGMVVYEYDRGFRGGEVMRCRRTALSMVLLMCATAVEAQQRGASGPAPDIAGRWTGAWSAYNPAQPSVPPKEQCAKLEVNVVRKGETYEATFEGDCGRPYKYTITMEGRASGGVVLFKGTVDLGPKDGGVYDWIGRATGNEFVGFYTNAYYTGVFSLSRQAKLP